MSYLITGGFGCIGSYVIRDLLNKGEEVVVYDIAYDLSISKLVLSEEQIKAIKFVQGDITDLPNMLRALKAHKVERVIHLASFQIPASNANPPLALRVNSEGTVNVFEAARILDLKKVVWASSVAVFGSPADYNHQRIANDAPHFPKSVYGACKSLNEFYGKFYGDNYGLDIVGLRFTAVYGVGRTRGLSSFSTKMIECVALGQPYKVPFSDDSIDWQYVEDVSRSIIMCSQAKKTKTVNFTVKGEIRPVKEGVAYIKKLVPEAQLTLEPGVFGISWDYDSTPIEQEIGFKPQYTMEQGILKTLNRFRELAGLKPIELK